MEGGALIRPASLGGNDLLPDDGGLLAEEEALARAGPENEAGIRRVAVRCCREHARAFSQWARKARDMVRSMDGRQCLTN